MSELSTRDQTASRTGRWADLANPTRFLALADRLVPWLAGGSAVILALGLYLSFTAPEDYQMGITVRILYIHVPFAWLSMLCYSLMAVCALGTLVWRHPLADVALKSAAPVGAVFTALALITGSIWGKPMWGTWWVWDGRLTSVFVLLLMYLGVISLTRALDDPVAFGPRRGDHDAGRLYQYSNHQILGGLVEYPAPAGVGDPPGRTDHPPQPAFAPAGYGRGVYRLVCRPAYDGHAQRGPSPACRRHAAGRGTQGRAWRKGDPPDQNALKVSVVSERTMPGTLAMFSLMNLPISTSSST